MTKGTRHPVCNVTYSIVENTSLDSQLEGPFFTCEFCGAVRLGNDYPLAEEMLADLSSV